MGDQGEREADAATGGACMPPGSPTCAKRAADGGSRRVIDRTCMSEQASARMARVRAAAETAGMEIGMRLRRVEGDKIFNRWRWGRVPMEGGGWLVTYQHDPIDEENLREVRLAIMQSQFEWGAYAVCECRSGERVAWYDGEEV